MVAHVLVPAVDERPASLSRRWIGGVLRGYLRFAGLVAADDLSMGGAASAGDLAARVSLARDAGCDLLPVCNDRPGVLALLQALPARTDPSSQLRLVRMRGKLAPPPGPHGSAFENLCASAAWRAARQWL
jgi:beta-N-acetylhexosaminidase